MYLYDSLYNDTVNLNVQTQLASLYRREYPENLPIQIEQIQRQQGIADCGLFAAAVCVTLALGDDPTAIHWRQIKMREHLKQCFETKHLIKSISICSSEGYQIISETDDNIIDLRMPATRKRF